MVVENFALTIVVDNTAGPGTVSEHGFSVWIETETRRVLLDTGQGTALPHNAEALGIDLERVDSLVLSHGHFDHTGAIAYVLQKKPDIDLYCHPGVTQPRYAIRNGSVRAIHMPQESMAALDKIASPRMHWLAGPERLSPEIGLTGPIARQSAIEDVGGPFFLDPHGRRKDDIEDDCAVWIASPRGLIVLMGCAHAGVINSIRQAQRQSGVQAIHAVIGGFHLLHAEAARIDWTLKALREFSPDLLVPCHCTGSAAVQAFKETFGERVQPGYAGMRLSF